MVALPSLETIYNDALEQAWELLLATDLQADRHTEQIHGRAEQMAQEAVEEELMVRRKQIPPTQDKPPREVPQVRHTRRKNDKEDYDSSPNTWWEDVDVPVLGIRWRWMVLRIQERRKWSARGTMLNYVKNGMPKSVDGPARGAFKHLGRWGWREIRHEW